MITATNMASIHSDKEWLRTNIEDESIRFYSFGDFTDVVFIGGGKYGEVFKAKLKALDRIVAYKLIYSRGEDETTEDFVKEVGNLNCNNDLYVIYHLYLNSFDRHFRLNSIVMLIITPT